MTFEEWKKTEIGIKCLQFPIGGIKPQEYLHNRLYMAFNAGKAEGNSGGNLQSTIDWYESQLRKYKTELKICKDLLKQYSDNEPAGA